VIFDAKESGNDGHNKRGFKQIFVEESTLYGTDAPAFPNLHLYGP
jgi:hypothetical protein